MKLTTLFKFMIPALLSVSISSEACSSLAINDNDGNVYHGRTLELPENIPSWVTYYPAGTLFQKKSPSGENGASYKSKYEVISITTDIYFDGDDHNMLEGVNSAGLSFSLNMMPSADLTPLSPSEYKNSIPVTSIGEWAVANFATVDDVRDAISKGHFWSPVLKNLGGVKSPFHLAFYDKNGGSIVVEARDGKFVTYDNITTVMTNGPDFPWHLTNLNNYTQLTNQDRSESKLGNIEVAQPDSGIAIATLPSSDTSVGRFIRGVYYTTYAPKSSSPTEAVNNLSHIMNRFDRMKNITVDANGGESGSSGKPVTEYTVWTSLSDLSNGEIFVRGYNGMNYKKYSIAQYKNSNKPVFSKIAD